MKEKKALPDQKDLPGHKALKAQRDYPALPVKMVPEQVLQLKFMNLTGFNLMLKMILHSGWI